jgi:hypothetical protein
MTTSRRLFPSLLAALSLFAASSYLGAQVSPTGSPVTVRGKITHVTGDTVSVGAAGGEARVQLSASAAIRREISIELSDITPGMYLGTTAEKQPDGIFRASEVHVFSEDQRGTGEGHRPSSSAPNSTMTNANVEKVEESVVQNVKGRMMALKYNGGEVRVFVPPDIPLVSRVPGNREMLKPGVEVTIRATRAPDGSISAGEITIRAAGAKLPV